MKKLIIYIAVMLCGITACGNKTNAAVSEQDSDSVAVSAADTIALETYHCEDSTKYAAVSATLSLPVGEGEAIKLMRDSLLQIVDKAFAFDMEGGRLVKRYTNAQADVRTILLYYCKPALKCMSMDAQSSFADIGEDCNPSGNDFSLTKTYEDSRLVVFTETDCYFAAGAAHPSSCAYTYTFDKQTGKLIRQFFKPGSEKKMQKLLIKGLVQYFKECGEDDVNAGNIREQLMLPDDCGNIIPLPQFAPTPGKDGLCFTYQQYEIACYAVGMPSFIIPYKDIEPYLTDEAKDLW